MASTAAAAVGSSFSPSIHTLKCRNTKNFLSDSLLKVPSTRITTATSIISRSYAIEPLSLVAVSWRVPRVSAAVAQEEAAATTPVEEGLPQDEQQQVAGEGEQEADQVVLNTKLYFGNLPYNVDSAQLAGIIQDYGTPELVEVPSIAT